MLPNYLDVMLLFWKRVIPAAEVQGMTRVGRRTKEGWGGRGRGNMRGGKGGDKGEGRIWRLAWPNLLSISFMVFIFQENHTTYITLWRAQSDLPGVPS